jgi:hypothetical protein
MMERGGKFSEQDFGASGAALAPWSMEQTLEVFDEWLLLAEPAPLRIFDEEVSLPNFAPILAVLGAVAANYLPGDPVWLGLVGPPSSAKTEILNSTALLPRMFQVGTLTVASLLSGTPKKQRDKGAKGGLLQEIGDFGIIAIKDFGSILTLRPDTKAETLQALRDCFDGGMSRQFGSDGGKRLRWEGKLGLIFASTGVIDAHHSVISSMGDRFLLSRLVPASEGQFERALKHAGAGNGRMRTELAQAVGHLFAGRRAEPRPISKDEAKSLDRVISLAVRLRGPVERDRHSRDIENIYGAEGTARIGLMLERLLAGLDVLGVERKQALTVVKAVAIDSVPPIRRGAYEVVCKYRDVETADVAIGLGLPTTTARRALEDLAAYRLVERRKAGGKDYWRQA